MTIQITGRNLDVGEAFRTFANEQIAAIVDKYAGSELTGHVRVAKEGTIFVTDCSLQLRSGLLLRSHGEGGDAYASAETAFEKLEKRLRRYKRRLKNHHHGGEQGTMEVPAARETPARDYVIEPGEGESDGETAHGAPVIIAETDKSVREMAVSEAVMMLDLADEPAMVFRNAGNGRINVVYRRKDGNVGWVDPD